MEESKTLSEMVTEMGGVEAMFGPDGLFGHAKDGRRWGRWIYRERNRTLEFWDGRYHLDLERIDSSAFLLDWIMQVAGKTWCRPKDIKNALAAIRVLIDPQATLCSWGQERGGEHGQQPEVQQPTAKEAEENETEPYRGDSSVLDPDPDNERCF